MDTRSKSEPAHLQTFVTVNKPAFESWLRAWTAGESFSLQPGSEQSREKASSTNQGNRLTGLVQQVEKRRRIVL